MERVTGIGGVFVHARDPDALGRWYRDNLGVALPPESYDVPCWWQEAGPTVLAAMPVVPGMVSESHPWSLNFRVGDLEAMVAQLRVAGLTVEVDPETYPNGRFASLADPEGNAVHLWQVSADAADPSDAAAGPG
jgi:predicted enzyme related to lactoylglutathione lyase